MKKTTPEAIQKITTKQEIIRSNKKTHKLTQEDIREIMLYYYLDNTKSTLKEILSKYNISKEYYYRLVKKEDNKKLIDNYITENRKLFTKKSELIIDKALNKINKNIDSGEVNNKDLITITGILYDKTRLEQNLSTQNNAISINIKIE
jgi:hypothetical protein